MKLENKILKIAAAAGIAVFALLPAASSYAASGEEVIKTRIAFMENEMGSQWKVLAAFARNGTGSLANVEKSARAIVDLTKKISGHFPKDTGRGNFPDDITRSLPVIWKDSERFQKDIQRLAVESEKLALLAKEGNKDAVVAMIGPTGSYARTKIGCAECHDTFRGPRVKQ